MSDITAQDIIDFWFKELEPKDWWKKSDDFDRMIDERFATALECAKHNQLAHWRQTPHGRLAEVIVLDQFSRNIYRDTAQAFAQDEMALRLSIDAVETKADLELNATEKAFLYMPYMHSESLEIHEQAIQLFAQPGLENNLDFEHKHKAIIDRFGRYPHRNQILGRESTAEEIEFLKQPGSSF